MSRPTLLFWLVAFLSVAVALVSFRFLALGTEAAFPVLQANDTANRTVFLTHVVAASAALAVAVPQFLPRLRSRNAGLHRWTGRAYALAVLAGGVSGGLLAVSAMPDRPVAGFGFGVLAILWLAITGYAVHLARAGQTMRHRTWMIRSFALTFAAVTLRLQLPVLFLLGMDYPQASNWVGWLCWVPNLIVAEWILRTRQQARPASGLA